jgi:hypothetical protein
MTNGVEEVDQEMLSTIKRAIHIEQSLETRLRLVRRQVRSLTS